MTSIIRLSASTLFFCCLTQISHALLLGQPSIPTIKEQILYLEIPYTEAVNSKSLQANLADGEDLSTLGIQNRDLNFNIRKTSTSRGVIVITSSKPIRRDHINFVIRVKELDTPYFKRIQIPFKATQPAKNEEQNLVPIKIKNEQDISSNVSPSSQVTSSTKTYSTQSTGTSTTKKSTLLSYPVQSNETLWSIASKISVQNNQPIFKVLKTIQSNNTEAFTEAGGSELKDHVVLNIPRHYFNKKQIRDIEKRHQSTLTQSLTKETTTSQNVPIEPNLEQNNTKNQSVTQKANTTKTTRTKAVPTVRQEVKQIRVRMQTLEHEINHLERELKQKDAKLDTINVRLAQLRKQLKKLNSRIAA